MMASRNELGWLAVISKGPGIFKKPAPRRLIRLQKMRSANLANI